MELSLSKSGLSNLLKSLVATHLPTRTSAITVGRRREKNLYKIFTRHMQANIKQYYYWIRIL